jgi:hypothetical protein
MEEVHRAIHETVLASGPKELAHKMGMSHTTLLNRANPNDDTHRLNVEQLLQIMLHSGDASVLRATAALLSMSAEVADVTRAVADALEDGKVSQTEKQLIKRELLGARESLDVLEASIKAA